MYNIVSTTTTRADMPECAGSQHLYYFKCKLRPQVVHVMVTKSSECQEAAAKMGYRWTNTPTDNPTGDGGCFVDSAGNVQLNTNSKAEIKDGSICVSNLREEAMQENPAPLLNDLVQKFCCSSSWNNKYNNYKPGEWYLVSKGCREKKDCLDPKTAFCTVSDGRVTRVNAAEVCSRHFRFEDSTLHEVTTLCCRS